MANCEENRIICSQKTAEKLIAQKDDGFYHPIDFRKALGMTPETEIKNDVWYGWGCLINTLDDGRIDIGFTTRWFSDIDIIHKFIDKYRDAEWWINQDDVDIYHYYWQDGEVIEDIHEITDEEADYLSGLWDKYRESRR